MEIILLITLIVFGSIIIAMLSKILINNSKKSKVNVLPELKLEIRQLETLLYRMESTLKDEFARNREEFLKYAKYNRDELSESFRYFNVSVGNHLDKLVKSNEVKLDKLREENNLKLENIRSTVDEKLHKTLEERLGQSFKLVTDKLEQVHKGLGEMQDLASGVGDLKRVLANVKTRGILGEIQLGNILEQILSPEQYELNVSTKKGSRDHVEFAVKLPGKDPHSEQVWLPIDSKFPLEVYQELLNAYDIVDQAKIEKQIKLLETNILNNAKYIRDKYIDPPNTTDFGILFLPIEGLYAEVVRNTSLMQKLQNQHKILVTGPTTLAALLNSLQMGFKTLAIEKRSSEVWNVLSAVKTEFNRFGEILEKTQTKLNQASNDLDKLVGTRTRSIQRKLSNINELPIEQANHLLDE